MSTHECKSSAGTVAQLVEARTGTSPLACYQCGRCAAGCPQDVPGEMDISPTQIMRWLQLESAFAAEPERAGDFSHRALSAETCWLCAGCQTCTTRCPQGVDIAGTMDVLRQESLARGVAAKTRRARDIQTLHRTFLATDFKKGRMHELTLVGQYELKTGHLFQDALLAPAMLRKGKLKLMPEKAVKTERVRAAIARLKSRTPGK